MIGTIRQRAPERLAAIDRGLGLGGIPVVGHHHREQPAFARRAGLGDVLVVGREGLGPVHHLAEHEEAEQALRKDQLLLHPLDVEIGEAGFDVGEAGRAFHAPCRGPRRECAAGSLDLLAGDGELIAAVAKFHPRRLILQMLGEAVDPAVGLQHVAVGRDDDRALRPRAVAACALRAGDSGMPTISGISSTKPSIITSSVCRERAQHGGMIKSY